MKKSLERVFKETELKTQELNNEIAQKVIEELEMIYGTKFALPGSKLTYPMIIQTLLFIPEYVKFREKLIELLEKYNVCETNIILRYLSIINQPTMTEEVKEIFETNFLSLPYYEFYEKKENGCIIETKEGVIEAYNLAALTDSEILYKLIKQNRYRQLCHVAVEECVPFYPEHHIVTSEINALFNGGYYHSYYKSSNNKEVVDLASNMIYKNSTFDNFYKPNELLNIKASKLNEEFNKLKQPMFHSQMAKTLQLALHNKINQK